MKNIVLLCVAILLIYLFCLSPLILVIKVLVSFKRKKAKLENKICDIEPIQTAKPMGSFSIIISILIIFISIVLGFIETWLFSLMVIPFGLYFFVLNIQSYKSNKLLGLYDGGIVMVYGLIIWSDIHSYFIKNDMICFYLHNGSLCEYKMNKDLLDKFEKENIMLNASA